MSWSKPVKVNNDKGTHYFPWIAAGSTGRIDFIWLNSPDYTPTDPEQSPWFATFAQTTNGNTATPKFQQTAASSSVMHVGGSNTVTTSVGARSAMKINSGVSPHLPTRCQGSDLK